MRLPRCILLLAGALAAPATGGETIWIAADQARTVSPLMVRSAEVGLVEEGALGGFLVPTVVASAAQPGEQSFAEFAVEAPRGGTYYLWARVRYPSGQPEAFAVCVVRPGGEPSAAQVLGGSRGKARQWHWDSQADAAGDEPGRGRLKLELPAGRSTLRVAAHRAGATVYHPLRWRQAEPALGPRLNALCLTDDPTYVPDDRAAGEALKLPPAKPALPRTTAAALPPRDAARQQALGRKPLPDWMRCPRWYTKDSWREELASRHAGDIAALVRQVAANEGEVLRLSAFWGGEAFFQSRVAPHAPGLGPLDYLREGVDEGRRTGVKIVVYMNPNALYADHPLYPDCAIRGADGQPAPRKAYGGDRDTAYYACINHPAYRRFLRDVLTEVFTTYAPDGLYVDGLTPHVCFCPHCRAKYRTLFDAEMPVEKLSKLPTGWAVWSEFGRDPQPVGDVANDLDARRLTQMLEQSLCEATHEFTVTVKGCKPDALTAYHSHPKPGCAADYDGTLTEVYSPRPWVHTAWRCGELAGYSNTFHVPVMFNVYPHEHFTAAEARYKALQGLANGAYPNFWSTPGMQPVFRFMARQARYLDFAATAPVRFVALPRDLHTDATQRSTPAAAGVSYGKQDRFLAPYVGAYSALTRAGLPVVTLHRPHFEEQLAGFQVLVLANLSNLSDAQVAAVREFVRGGGGLIATHETALCDGAGRRRDDFALADVLGVRYQRTLPAQSRPLRLAADQPIAQGLAGLPALEDEGPLVAVEPTLATAVAWAESQPPQASVPALLVNNFGKGRAVYLPGRLDALQCERLTPAVERLFAAAVRWASGDRVPAAVRADGPVGITLFEQPGRMIVHLVNHDRDSQFRSDAFRPLERVELRLRPPEGLRVVRAERLWSPRSLPPRSDGPTTVLDVGRLDEYELIVAELAPAAPMELGLGGAGGVYLLAAPGELVVEVEKRDRNRGTRRIELRAILVGPDRAVLDEQTIRDDGLPPGKGFGPPQRARLTAAVARPGVYALNVTASQDRYGDEFVWGFRTNCPKYLIETARGHRDERHQEPIVLANPGRPGRVCFVPRRGTFQIEVTGLPAGAAPPALFDDRGAAVGTLPPDARGKATLDVPADPKRPAAPWRLELPEQQATIHIDGVTRWERDDLLPDAALWTPDAASYFPLAEHRWLLTPYRHENEQFGHLPDYPVENQPYFDPANRPYVVTARGLAARREGRWGVSDGGEVSPAPGPLATSKVAFDRDGDVYVLGASGRRAALGHSRDGGATCAWYPLPARDGLGQSFDIEQFSGHNLPDGPPPILRYTNTANDPKHFWRRVHDLELFLPRKADGRLTLGEPILISQQCIGLAAHSGCPSGVVSRDGKVHVVWAEATAPEAKAPGVPIFAATCDRAARTLGKPALVAHGAPANDIHNTPSITMDRGGHLHVVGGTHGRPFPYARSLAANDAAGGWSEPATTGEGLSQTYVGLVCGPDDTLHLVYRLWRSGEPPHPASQHAVLAYQRKRPGQPWEPPRPLVVPPFSEYSVYYHRLTMDRAGRLFVSYDAWTTHWFYRNDHRGSRRALLLSADGGQSWKLAEDGDFR